METKFEALCTNMKQAFGHQRLSAADNVKLLASVIQPQYGESFGFKALYLPKNDQAQEIYGFCWKHEAQSLWIHCGAVNSYSSHFELMNLNQAADLQQIEVIEIPLLPIEQLHLLFMQYAHFDHC